MDLEFNSKNRILWLKKTLAGVLFFSFLSSVGLWINSRTYPLTPITNLLPVISYPWDYIWLCFLLFLLIWIFISDSPKTAIIIFVVLAAALSLFDQSRWMPWFYQYVLMLTTLIFINPPTLSRDIGPSEKNLKTPLISAAKPQGILSGGRINYGRELKNDGNKERVLNICRLILASIYFWSGIQKINPHFINVAFPYFISPLFSIFPSLVLLGKLGVLIPFIEIGVGIGLLIKKYRGPAIFLGISSQLFIILIFLSWGIYVRSVFLWNLAMIIFVILLFYDIDNVSWREIILPHKFIPHFIAVILLFMVPVASFFHPLDTYFSLSIFAGRQPISTLYLSDSLIKRLPSEISSNYVYKDANGKNILDIAKWSFSETGVLPYPEKRIYINVLQYICVFSDDPSDAYLVLSETANGFSKTRRVQYFYCQE